MHQNTVVAVFMPQHFLFVAVVMELRMLLQSHQHSVTLKGQIARDQKMNCTMMIQNC